MDADPHPLWDQFLAAWPPERVRSMRLEQYTNLEHDDAFIYWLEKRLEGLGSIWGGSAFKFGIYERDNLTPRPPERGYVWGERYAWVGRMGKTAEEAFATVRGRLVEVVDAARAGAFARVEAVDLSDVLKWKVAFLYQDRSAPGVFPVFKREALFRHYRRVDPGARPRRTPYHVMYETLLGKHQKAGDVFDVARLLWGEYKAERDRGSRAWAVPLAWMSDERSRESLFTLTTVEPEDIEPALDRLLATAELAEGDQLALLVDDTVRALATLTNAEPGQYAWQQVPVDFSAGLSVVPTAEVRELEAAERQEIWSQAPAASAAAAGAVRYWKIAPGRDAVAWPEWLSRGIAAVGWPDLGDLTGLTRAEFEAKAKTSGYRAGVRQAWTFRTIQPGDRVVANQGKHSVVGLGTVLEGYRFVPGTHTVNGEDYPHQIRVRWDDTTRRPVDKYGWQSTVLELTRNDFEALLGPTSAPDAATAPSVAPEPPAPPPPPCRPQNIILYGPPGTGKTYSTVRRALELVLGRENIAGLSEKQLTTLFREQQARGQIEFVTFHQAYGYEEFVEGIRPVLDGVAGAGVAYELHDGAFKAIALRAAAEGLRGEVTAVGFDGLWSRLVADLAAEEGRVARSQSGKTYRLELSTKGNVLVRTCTLDGEGNVTVVGEGVQTASRDGARLLWECRNELGPEPETFTYQKTCEVFARERGGQGGNQYTALWIVYTQLLALHRSAGARERSPGDLVARVQEELDQPGETTTFSFSARTPQYVLVIDEINRGNISKILGELITILEPDKRIGAPNELKLPLAYSPRHRFAVPPNLHILGTMNTADRSIALMDVALRRRFTFEELMPDVEVIRAVLGGDGKVGPSLAFVDLVADLFVTLNDRIRFLYDRDHQLGHACFLGARDLESLRAVFVDRVVPMLQEYFYGAWEKMGAVLGCPYDTSGQPRRTEAHLRTTAQGRPAYAQPIVVARPFPEVATIGFDHDDYEDRVDYQVRPEFRSGGLSDAELVRTFLSVLVLDAGTFAARERALLGAAAAQAPSQPASGPAADDGVGQETAA